MRVLVTGQDGFLLRNTLKYKQDWKIIPYRSHMLYSDIDLVIHFASPSDIYEFEDKPKMASTMVDLTLKMIQQAKKHNCKFIFASSMGAEIMDNEYSIYKKAMENYIIAMLDEYLILRIPRVYGRDRTKGLMRHIHDGKIPVTDWDKRISYIDIESFKVWFNQMLNESGIQFYTERMQFNTIEELRIKYCES